MVTAVAACAIASAVAAKCSIPPKAGMVAVLPLLLVVAAVLAHITPRKLAVRVAVALMAVAGMVMFAVARAAWQMVMARVDKATGATWGGRVVATAISVNLAAAAVWGEHAKENVAKLAVLAGYGYNSKNQGKKMPLNNTYDFADGNGPVLAYRYRNPDRTLGGWVARTAKILGNVFIGPSARVYGNATVFHIDDGSEYSADDLVIADSVTIFGNAEIKGAPLLYGNAKVYGNAKISGAPQMFDNAELFGEATLSGAAQIMGNARVFENATITGQALIGGNAEIFGEAIVTEKAMISGAATVSGSARISGSSLVTAAARITGNAKISGNAKLFKNARVSDNAEISGDTWLIGSTVISGNVRISSGVFLNKNIDSEESLAMALI